MPIVEKITSLQNDRIKAVRALEMRKVRRRTGLFVAEGASVLIAAQEAAHVPETVVFQSDALQNPTVGECVQWAAAQGATCLPTTEAVLSKLSGKDNPQTVLAVFRQQWMAPPNAETLQSDALWLALEEVRDPGNLGTIVRTVDAVGGAGIILIGACCDAYSRECVRATMGSIFSVPLVRMSLDAFADWRAGVSGDVVGTHLAGRVDFRAFEYERPCILVMGSEGPGISETVAGLCTQLVKVPMAGRLDSLNLGVATALLLYHIQGERLSL